MHLTSMITVYRPRLNEDGFCEKIIPKMLLEKIKKDKKGYKCFIKEVWSGFNGDDFPKNNISIMAFYKAYKKPRFIK